MNDLSFIKQYLVQSISYATVNLRLDSRQTEALAMIKELILKSDNLEIDLIKMKKVTELSTFAIRLHEMFSSIDKNPIDILSISDKFRQQSQQLIKDVNLILYNATKTNFKTILDKMKKVEEIAGKKKTIEKVIDEKLILEDDKKDTTAFTSFEEKILKPIKPIDSFFNEVLEKGKLSENIDQFIETMKKNSGLAKEKGFDILSGMHTILSDSLYLLKEGTLKADKDSIESLRACLIVIAAVVRGKKVDISDYLNKAENFSKKISLIKSKELK